MGATGWTCPGTRLSQRQSLLLGMGRVLQGDSLHFTLEPWKWGKPTPVLHPAADNRGGPL